MFNCCVTLLRSLNQLYNGIRDKNKRGQIMSFPEFDAEIKLRGNSYKLRPILGDFVVAGLLNMGDLKDIEVQNQLAKTLKSLIIGLPDTIIRCDKETNQCYLYLYAEELSNVLDKVRYAYLHDGLNEAIQSKVFSRETDFVENLALFFSESEHGGYDKNELISMYWKERINSQDNTDTSQYQHCLSMAKKYNIAPINLLENNSDNKVKTGQPFATNTA